jgi:pimeloyl-ACP methyl ester carboxylesterase
MISSDGVELAATVDEGDSAAVVLLHGLAGYRDEWNSTAAWLRDAGYRVATYDGRGHGDSTRRPADVSREATVADAAAVLRTIGGGPHVLMGQSLGGHTAFLTAAAHPELVSALVVLEAGPAYGEPNDHIKNWLASWPLPFPSRDAAADFLGHGDDRIGAAWADGLGVDLAPRFDPDIIVATIRAHAGRAYWDQWASITVPTMAVLAENGYIDSAEEQEMRRLRPDATMVRLPGLGHDLHLQDPDAVRDAVLPFLDGLDRLARCAS